MAVIDKAGFHSTKNIQIPENIPAYTPELNPCGQVWKHIKQGFKNRVFKAMEAIREWLGKTVRDMSEKTIMSITSNHHYITECNAKFKT